MKKLLLLFISLQSLLLFSQDIEWENWNKRVYLATYQRSGNHWMRYLIEEATGLATSAVWQDKDPLHLPTVFPWGGFSCDHGYEGTRSYPTREDAVVIKTHFPSMENRAFDLNPYFLTVRIVRHPLDSFYSRYTYGQMRGYIKENSRHQKSIPKKLLLKYITDWSRFQEYWNQQENVLTIRYEDLVNHPKEYLQVVLESAGYTVTQEDIQRAVDKYPPITKCLKHIEHFTQEDLSVVESNLQSLMSLYDYDITKINNLYTSSETSSPEILPSNHYYVLPVGNLLDPKWKDWDQRAYLAAYPRCGTHWLRYLIEEAAGIATSNVIMASDPPHLPTMFPWKGFCCNHGYEGTSRYPTISDAVLIKTHFPCFKIAKPFDQQPYFLTIRMVRHPLDSFYSRYVYAQKLDHVEKELCNQHFIPKERLLSYISSWCRFQEHWNLQPNVLTIRYEDLFNQPAVYLQLIVNSLGYSVSQEDIQRAINKYPPVGSFLKYLDHYTQEDLDLVEEKTKNLMSLYDYELLQVNNLK